MTIRLVLLALLAAALGGCGGNDGGEVATTAPTTTAAAEAWKRVVAGRDCQCSDGSQFSYFVRKASPKKVVFYLQDGGACYSAETCAADNDLFTRSVEGPTGEGGIFDFADDRNPFANHSFVYVPYCTGDVHLGSVTTEYAPGLTVRHKGFVNATAALDDLAAAFPGATDVVVIGESAGSIAAPLYAGLAADRLPDARIAVVADGSGAYPDAAALNDVLAAWGFGNASPNWPESTGLPAKQWSFPGLYIQSGRHDAKIVFARHDYAFDEEQESRLSLIGIRARKLLARIDANEAQIEDAGVNLLSYIAPGDDHTVLSDGLFYTEAVDGVKLVDWVTRVIEGERVDDVHCRKCGTG